MRRSQHPSYGAPYSAPSLAGIETGLSPWRAPFARAIPLRPIATGFGFNVAVYSALLLILTVSIRQSRRVVRRARGLCPNCAYVRGVGEVPLVPPMAAIANAIYDAIGIRMNQLPMSPGRIVEAQLKKEAGDK